MLIIPKGYKYWKEKNGKQVISDDAPMWAKEEFERYQKDIEESENEDSQGNINHIQGFIKKILMDSYFYLSK